MHTTNYFNAFIEIAEDCAAERGELPPVKEGKTTIANLQFDMLYDHPYEYTSDEIFFTVHATRKEFRKDELEEERQIFFSKGQPCFRASPLTKRYGWGIHSNEEGKVAMYGMETKAYAKFVADESLKKTKAMRSKRAKK